MSLRNSRPRIVDRRSSRVARCGVAAVAVFFCALGSAAPTVSAQGPTTIQLPTYHEFSVSTTVMVPDRGGMVLGGVSSSSQSSLNRGVPGASKIPGAGRLFGNRAIGRDTGTSTASVHAWIHNLDELDAATLAAARRDSGSASRTLDDDVERKAAFLAKNVGRPSATTAASASANGATAREKNSRSRPDPRLGIYDPRR